MKIVHLFPHMNGSTEVYKERKKKKRKESEKESPVATDTSAFFDNEPLYCTCKQVSYGQMIGCENTECPVGMILDLFVCIMFLFHLTFHSTFRFTHLSRCSCSWSCSYIYRMVSLPMRRNRRRAFRSMVLSVLPSNGGVNLVSFRV